MSSTAMICGRAADGALDVDAGGAEAVGPGGVDSLGRARSDAVGGVALFPTGDPVDEQPVSPTMAIPDKTARRVSRILVSLPNMLDRSSEPARTTDPMKWAPTD
jgi:hypothetical protein